MRERVAGLEREDPDFELRADVNAAMDTLRAMLGREQARVVIVEAKQRARRQKRKSELAAQLELLSDLSWVPPSLRQP